MVLSLGKMVASLHIFFKTHQTVHLMGALLYVNYISIKIKNLEIKKTIEKISETKSWFFEKIKQN